MARTRASGARPRGPALSSTGKITADASLAQAQKNEAYFKRLLTGTHAHDMGELREAEHKGHHIVIETTYTITIDGKPFRAPLGVTNDGSVHYHGMPNVGFDSAIDLVKAVIDTFPGEFAAAGGHGGHGHPGDHGGHAGMRMARAKGRSRKARTSARTRPKTTKAKTRRSKRARR
jgi:hypothetical protein